MEGARLQGQNGWLDQHNFLGGWSSMNQEVTPKILRAYRGWGARYAPVLRSAVTVRGNVYKQTTNSSTAWKGTNVTRVTRSADGPTAP